MKARHLSREELVAHLNYDEATGIFTRKKSGLVAGGVFGDGYIAIRVGGGRRYPAHRLAWLYVHGVMPEMDVDHINRVKTDNRIKNLRLATRSQNMINTPPPATNKTGAKGVSYCSTSRKYRARCWVNQKCHHLGWFDSLTEAASAYEQFAKERYGEFAEQRLGSAA